MTPPRLYLDTSVIGGYYDAEFALATRRLFRQVRDGVFTAVISEVVRFELEPAPERVRRLLALLENGLVEVAENGESLDLARAYMNAGIVSAKYFDDCRHVAIATVARVNVLVSWNFKHIVRYDRIRRFNELNVDRGHGVLDIRSPMEVIFRGD